MRRHTTTNVVIVVMGLVIFWLSQWNWVVKSNIWEKAEGALIDARYNIRGERPPDTNIVLLGVGDSSITLSAMAPEEIAASPILQLMSQPTPWDRRVYAATLNKLMGAGAKIVVFDFVFASPKPEDAEFASILKKYQGRVVLTSMFDVQPHKFDSVTNDSTYTAPSAELSDAVTTNGIGYGTVWPDKDEVIRRARYRTSLERESGALNMTDMKGFLRKFPDDLYQMSALAVKEFTGRVETPPYDHNNFIDFQGRQKTYKPMPIEDIFVDKLWSNPPFTDTNGVSAFRNKIVIVGPIANIFQDIHATPFGDMPGPELQAQTMATLLHNASLWEPSPIFSTIVTLAMIGLAVAICLGIHNAIIKAALLIFTSLSFLVACQVVFSSHSLVIDMLPPLFGFMITGLVAIILQFILEQLERRRTLNILERYVSKNVAKVILDDQRSFLESLSGRKQSLTIMFSDIRGFTSMTEGSDPEQLVQQLNEYFMEMVGIVLAERGTLQKFIGDAIMAAWGDVLSEGAETDARQAVRTALKWRASLVKLNKRWETQPNRVPLHIGIGVNHGEVIVCRVGHPQRMEFTVLGDGVNLAARFESATKQFRADLLVSESVESLTRNHFIFRRVGLLTVKGKTKPVEAFDVLGERPQTDPSWLARYHEAIGLFRGRNWEAASDMFKVVLAEIGQADFLCQMYIDWCATYAKTPPPKDWNGTFVLSEK